MITLGEVEFVNQYQNRGNDKQSIVDGTQTKPHISIQLRYVFYFCFAPKQYCTALYSRFPLTSPG